MLPQTNLPCLGRLVLPLLAVLLLACIPTANAGVADNLFCGRKNCYDILGVSSSADVGEIKKSYRRLSILWHPDKNKDPKAIHMWRDLANAYEILSDATKREAYDYYQANPDSYYAAYRGMRAVYDTQTHPLTVLVGLIVVTSLLQYVNQKWKYTYYRNLVVRTRKFQQVLDEEFAQKCPPVVSKKFTKAEEEEKRQALVEELLATRVQVSGASKPDWKSVVGYQVCMLPVTLPPWIKKHARWYIKFKLLKHPYGPEERMHVMLQRLGMTREAWDMLEEERKFKLRAKQLWDDKMYAEYLKEKAEEEREARVNDPRYKQYKRWRKRVGDTSYMMGDN